MTNHREHKVSGALIPVTEQIGVLQHSAAHQDTPTATEALSDGNHVFQSCLNHHFILTMWITEVT